MIITACIKRICIILIAFFIICLDNPQILANDANLKSISSQTITSGAILKKYTWNTVRNNKNYIINASVIEVDLSNPNVRIDSMAGTDQQFTRNQTIVDMTNNTKAVAGINGDFYNTKAEGVPEGSQILDGNLIATPPKISGLYSFIINKDNKPIIDIYNFQGKVIAENGESYELGGINKTYYWGDSGKHSHIDGLFMYTNVWGSVDRSNDGVTFPSEVLVQNDRIEYIGIDEVIKTIPTRDGYILRATGKATDFVKNNFKVGQQLKIDYKLLPLDASINDDPKTFKMMIGGNTLLVHDGKPTWYTRNIKSIDGYGYRARSAVGYSQDKNTVYLITVDNYGTNSGMSISELQQFMIDIGVWRGMVLDGGGSTQMAARPLGEFDNVLVNKTETGWERKVVNGIGVYSTAPESELSNLILQGPKEVFMNQPYAYSVKGYDGFYNPKLINDSNVIWTIDNMTAELDMNKFVINKSGTTKIKAQLGNVASEIELHTIERNDINEMVIKSNEPVVTVGQPYKFNVNITTKSGNTMEVPQPLLKWEVQGALGEIKDGIITIKSFHNYESINVIASYNGFSTMKTIPVGIDQIWYNLDQFSYLTTASASKSEVKSMVEIINEENGNKNLVLNYDFTMGSGSKEASAVFASNSGIIIEGTPQYVKLNVYGDQSLNQLVAEFQDANNITFQIPLVQQIDWKGWQEVSSSLAKFNMKYPISIKRIFIKNDEQKQDEQLTMSQIRLDDIRFTYKSSVSAAPLNTMIIAVNDKNVIINNKSYKIDVPPLIINGKTILPIEVVVTGLGGTVRWDQNDRKVSIIQRDKLLELWINNPQFSLNGKKIFSEISPVILNNKTYVPLRVVANSLGWKLLWNEKNQSIKLN